MPCTEKPRLVKDLGTKFPRPDSKDRKRYGIYECPNCLKEFETQTASVKSGRSKQCRKCADINKKKTHGSTNTRLYKIWRGIKSRCNNENDTTFKYYGAKGVTVCKEWDKFEPFQKWSLDNGYSDELVLDKDTLCEAKNINPKIYSPDTCIWITKDENIKEKNVRLYEIKELNND